MVFARVAAQESDVETALGMASVGDSEAEHPGIEIDHLFQVEGVKPDVAKLGVRHLVHSRSRTAWSRGGVGIAAAAPLRQLGNRRPAASMPELRPGFFTFLSYLPGIGTGAGFGPAGNSGRGEGGGAAPAGSRRRRPGAAGGWPRRLR